MTIISGAAVGSGVGTASGVVGLAGGTAMTLHGFHGAISGFNGARDALNGTKTGGPLEQIGIAIGGEKWGDIGRSVDSAISLRGWAKGALGSIRGSNDIGDAHAAGKGIYDNVITKTREHRGQVFPCGVGGVRSFHVNYPESPQRY